jgi:hypothetical protein
MKKTLCLSAFLAASLLAGCSHPQPVYAPPPPPPPQLNYQAIEQQGMHDGFEAARHDVASGRPPAFDHHPRYRNPPVPPPAFPSYRQGFRRGYEQFLHQGPPPPPQ